MKHSYLLIAIIFLTLVAGGFLFPACQLAVSPTEEVTFILPQWPPQSELKIQYPVLSKWLVQVEGPDISQEFFTDETKLEITLPKNIPCSITAAPITNTTSFFYPAGTIYPYEITTELEQKLTWENGYVATLMQSIYKSPIETGITSEHIQNFQKSFNWKKCQDYIQKQINSEGEKFYNPWQINTQALLENLCYASFSTTYLTPKNIYTVSLDTAGLLQCKSVLSRYIPENQNIIENKVLTLQKNKMELFMCEEKYCAQITCSSSKKVSVAYTYLPILYLSYENYYKE